MSAKAKALPKRRIGLGIEPFDSFGHLVAGV
jgi:hypothetical protein